MADTNQVPAQAPAQSPKQTPRKTVKQSVHVGKHVVLVFDSVISTGVITDDSRQGWCEVQLETYGDDVDVVNKVQMRTSHLSFDDVPFFKKRRMEVIENKKKMEAEEKQLREEFEEFKKKKMLGQKIE